MARIKPTSGDAVEVEVETTEVETQEVEQEAGAEVEGSGEQETAAEAQPEAELDISSFEQAFEAALEEADTSTGVLPTEALDKVATAYRELDGAKAKGAARKLVDTKMESSVEDDDIVVARSCLLIAKAMKAGKAAAPKKEREPKKPADPTEAFVNQIVTLDLARVVIDINRPEGLAEDVNEKIEALYNELYQETLTYRTWLLGDKDSRGDEPEVNALAKGAAKISLGKAVKAGRASGGSAKSSTATPYTGPRRSPLAHLKEVFEGVSVGTELKISEIVNTKSSIYEAGEASPGALTNCLKNKAADLKEAGIEGRFGRPVSAVKVA